VVTTRTFCCVVLTLGCRPAARAGSINNSALQLLPSLSQLTALSVWGTAVSAGLQHLSGLSRLRELRLNCCNSIRDEHILSLSALRALTALHAEGLTITGARLSALASLRSLRLHACPKVAAAGLASIAQLQQLQQLSLNNSYDRRATQLAPLSQLTNLQELHVLRDWIEGPALALLDLPHLTSLEAWRISAEQHEAGRGAAIRSLGLRSTRDTPLAMLLPLPSLEQLAIHRAYGDLAAVGQQPQLTHLGLGGLCYSGGGLAGVLLQLRHLQVLQLSRVWDCLTLEDMLALAQLPQLEELCIADSDAPAELYCLLQRCARLRKVVLQACRSVGLPAMTALVSKPGMREVALRGVKGGEEVLEERLQRVARQLGVQLTHSTSTNVHFWDRTGCYSSSEDDEQEQEVEGQAEWEMEDVMESEDEEEEDEEEDWDDEGRRMPPPVLVAQQGGGRWQALAVPGGPCQRAVLCSGNRMVASRVMGSGCEARMMMCHPRPSVQRVARSAACSR
jgi:hypothetical protein